jgi:hypothetical protein
MEVSRQNTCGPRRSQSSLPIGECLVSSRRNFAFCDRAPSGHRRLDFAAVCGGTTLVNSVGGMNRKRRNVRSTREKVERYCALAHHAADLETRARILELTDELEQQASDIESGERSASEEAGAQIQAVSHSKERHEQPCRAEPRKVNPRRSCCDWCDRCWLFQCDWHGDLSLLAPT